MIGVCVRGSAVTVVNAQQQPHPPLTATLIPTVLCRTNSVGPLLLAEREAALLFEESKAACVGPKGWGRLLCVRPTGWGMLEEGKACTPCTISECQTNRVGPLPMCQTNRFGAVS